MGSKEHKPVYLGKGGQTHGPIPHEQYEQLKLSGEIDQYTYIWDDASKDWMNLDPKPPAVGEGGGTGTTTRRRGGNSLESTEAVCHDHHEVVIGLLENVSETGCELISDEHSAAPKLALHTPLVLNVTNAAGEKGMNVKASLSSVSRRGGAWVYRIRWAELPTF